MHSAVGTLRATWQSSPVIVKKTVNACITAWLGMGVSLTLTDSDRILRTTSKASSSHRRKHRTVPRALQVTLCDPTWYVSSRSGVATLRTAIHLLFTYLQVTGSTMVGSGRNGSGRFTRWKFYAVPSLMLWVINAIGLSAASGVQNIRKRNQLCLWDKWPIRRCVN